MLKFLQRLDSHKIKLNAGRPIEMRLFLSFLTVKTSPAEGDFLGKCNGWTRHYGPDDLEIGGGIVRGIEYLDVIQYKRNLDNPYNNYVNPFYLWEILNKEGRSFFLTFYEKDIKELRDKAQTAARKSVEYAEEMETFWKKLEEQSMEVSDNG